MARTNVRGIPRAAGYRGVDYLETPIFVDKFLTNFKECTMIDAVTNKNILPAKIIQCGNEVIFREEPDAEIFDYVRNQDLDVSEFETGDSINMKIDKAKYYNLKLNTLDAGNCMSKKYVDNFIDNARRKMELSIEREMFRDLLYQISQHNKGSCAGKMTHMHDLGELGTPRLLSRQNAFILTMIPPTVLAEGDLGACGGANMKDVQAIFPEQARPYLMGNPELANACCASNTEPKALKNAYTGTLTNMGVTFHFAKTLPTYKDNGVRTFVAYYFHKDSIGFIKNMLNNEVIDKDPRSFSKYWRALLLYGYKLLRPEHAAAFYFQLDELV